MPRKFFWITPKWPLPAEDGARRATVNLVRALTAEGADIHLCAIVSEAEAPDPVQLVRELGVTEVSLVRRRPSRPVEHVRNLLTRPGFPVTVAPYGTRAVARQIEAIFQKDPSREVVFDGLHTAGWLARTSKTFQKSLRKIYRAHNVETDIWKRAALQKERNPAFRALMSFQSRLMASFESSVCRESILTATVSEDDALGFQRLCGPVRTRNIPIGIGVDPRLAGTPFPKERRLLFIGRMDWRPNKEGLQWFLEKVWPEVSAFCPDMSLTIVGAGDGRWLEAYQGLKNVKMLGRVPEVAPAYLESAAALVPVFFGSGTRVKAIEASMFARPCISTAVGVEGIGLDEGKSYFRAESREDWVRVLREFKPEEAHRRGEAAFEKVSADFDPHRIARKFLAD